MRTTAPRTNCIHKWAHNTEEDSSGRTGNVSYFGMSLSHYATVIAVKYPKKHTVVIAGDGIRNSTTTMRNKSRAVDAMPDGWNFLYVDCDTYGYDLQSMEGLRKCHTKMLARLKEKAKAVADARQGVSKAVAFQLYDQYRDFCNQTAVFLHRKPVPADALGADVMADVTRGMETRSRQETARLANRAEQNRRNEINRMAYLATRIEKEKEDAALWRAHEYKGSAYNFENTYLRLSRDGAHVETSRGVVVPFDAGLLLYRLCERNRAKSAGAELSLGDISIGGYHIQWINAEGDAKVGCHMLKFDEMQRCFEEAESRDLVGPEKETGT